MKDLFRRAIEIALGIVIAAVILGTLWFAYSARQISLTNHTDIMNIANYLQAQQITDKK